MNSNGTAKKIIAIIMFAVTALGAFLSVSVVMYNRGMEPVQARESVVYVEEYLYDSFGDLLYAAAGTGWATGDSKNSDVQYVVTNGHVVAEAYTYPKADPDSYVGEIRLYFSAAENDYAKASVVYYSPADEKDIAVLKLPSPTNKRKPLMLRNSDTVAEGEQVYAIGYPGVSDVAANNIRYDAADVTFTSGVISKRVTLTETDYPAFQTDAAINSGNSGGPLVDTNGFVVGVNTAGLGVNVNGEILERGINYASEINQTIRILREEGLPYMVRGDRNMMLYIGLIVAVVSAVVGLILLLTSGSKAAAPAQGPNMMQQQMPPQGAMPGGMPPQQQPQPQRNGNRPVLRGVAGKFAGQSFDFSQGRLILGRDPASCNVVFDKDTPGISGNHCQVVYDNVQDVFVLTDNGSSYGTFLDNGTKLAKAVPVRLKAGESFYLSNKSVRFILAKE